MVNVAVICVALTTFTALTAMPGLLTATVAPETMFVPVSVTGAVAPWTPLAGAMVVNVGTGARVTLIEAVRVWLSSVALTDAVPAAVPAVYVETAAPEDVVELAGLTLPGVPATLTGVPSAI